MILDKNGNEIPVTPNADEPHRFGHFRLPENTHIRGFDGIGSTDGCGGGTWAGRRRENPNRRNKPRE